MDFFCCHNSFGSIPKVVCRLKYYLDFCKKTKSIGQLSRFIKAYPT